MKKRGYPCGGPVVERRGDNPDSNGYQRVEMNYYCRT